MSDHHAQALIDVADALARDAITETFIEQGKAKDLLMKTYGAKRAQTEGETTDRAIACEAVVDAYRAPEKREMPDKLRRALGVLFPGSDLTATGASATNSPTSHPS